MSRERGSLNERGAEREEDAMHRRIIVALDGSDEAEQVLPPVETLAERFGALVILLRVTPVAGMSPEALDEDRREADHYLTTLSNRLTAKGLQVRYQRLEGPPTELIAEQARTQNADLIALTTHGRAGVRGALFGRRGGGDPYRAMLAAHRANR